MDGESDLVLWKQTGPQKVGTGGVPESELSPVPEDDDLNTTVIEVMTDVEVLLDGSSVIDVFAVNSARRKRVEISERKLTESDRQLFRHCGSSLCLVRLIVIAMSHAQVA